MSRHQPITEALSALLRVHPHLRTALEASLRSADRPGIRTLTGHQDFLDAMVTLIPTRGNLMPAMLEFYWLISRSPGDVLRKDAAFSRWVHRFAEEWGRFLDTPESARCLPSFHDDPSYHREDYYVAPSGWLTFNQFFARQVRPGARPVDGPCDDAVVVSPADAVYQGQWPVSEASEIEVKGITYPVLELLEGSPYQDRFRGGVFTHSQLEVYDYHYYHTPVAGVVKELRTIRGEAWSGVAQQADGTLVPMDETGFQFVQQRGLLVLESPLGLVAVLPIGMAQVSSVNLTPRVGATLAKGQDFGFFLFGGSDIVTLFEAGRVELVAEVGAHYNQGRQVGRAVRAGMGMGRRSRR
jgi:phosphatidylserine decarboxylase precursor